MNDQQIRDREIRRAFEARASATPSPELVERISTAARVTRQQRSLRWMPEAAIRNGPRLMWAAVISLLSLSAVGFLLVGGRPDNDLSVQPSPPPSESPSLAPTPALQSPSAPPTDEPSPTASVPAGFAKDTVVRTVVGDLRVRSAPGVSESSQKLEPLLPMDARLFVVDGPVAADGYDWYQIQQFDSTYLFGWVAAASQAGEAWLRIEDQVCPTSPLDAGALLGLDAYGGLACFQGDEIQLAVDLTCEELVAVEVEITGPTWLRYDRRCFVDLGTYFIGVNEAGPNLLPVPTAGRMLITGHFDDPQAASCVSSYESPAPDPAAVVFGCRNQFVATSIVPAP